MTERIRIGVIGLGMMGRHHARIARDLGGLVLTGGADPAGDAHHALWDRPVFNSVDGLLAVGIDAAVVAVPSEVHESVALELADAGVHVLVEKPLADTLEAAIAIKEAFRDTGLVASVGHVERFNPAIRELKRKLDTGDLGRVISIRTRRAGPHPKRVRNIGVVRDLATHDIDLVLWLGGAFEHVTAEIAHRLDDPYEDLVEAIGRLEDGTVVSVSVNWLTPTKERSVTVLGERGALVADLLSADLTFYANADIPVEWEALAQLKGVSEGDMVRYALAKPEPLRVQLENFRDAVLGVDGAQVVTLEEGVEVLRTIDSILPVSIP